MGMFLSRLLEVEKRFLQLLFRARKENSLASVCFTHEFNHVCQWHHKSCPCRGDCFLQNEMHCAKARRRGGVCVCEWKEEGGGHLFLPSLLDQGHFSLGISWGQLHQQSRRPERRGRRGREVKTMAAIEREALKTVAVFRVCAAWWD